jgi:hypothetical protein
MSTEIRSGDHGEVVRVRGMEQGMEVGEAGALSSERREIFILKGDVVVDIFEDDDQDAVKVMGWSTSGGAFRLFLFCCGRLSDLRQFGVLRLLDSSPFCSIKSAHSIQ